MPARSIVRNVALFGRPMAGPVMASISSIEYPASALRIACPRPENLHDAVEADAIGDEVRRVPGGDHALAEPVIAELGNGLFDRRVGVGRADDLDQPQIARRVEEVGSEGVRPERRRPAFDDRRDRNARRIGADDGVRRAVAVDALEERLLDVEPFDDGFDDPVGGGDGRKVLVEAAGANERGTVGGEERIRLELARARQALARGVAGDVEQQHRDAGVGEVRGNLRPHRAGAENADGPYAGAHRRAPLPRRRCRTARGRALRQTGPRSRRPRRRANTCDGSGSSWSPSRRGRRRRAWRRASG